MQLREIDKATYRKRMNIVLAGTVIILLVTSLTVSNTLIAAFGSDIDGDNFWWNITGVLAGLSVIGLVYKIFGKSPFMAEVNYVRSLKAEMNRIYRSSKKINAALEQNDKTAIIISYFNLQASKQVYQLDNNTLTMDELNEKIRVLDAQIESLGLEVSTDDYRPELVKQLSA
tara:strand:- start:232 stop:747 length:516 start_codon:yes stop_codon:yes gene_type:complete